LLIAITQIIMITQLVIVTMVKNLIQSSRGITFLGCQFHPEKSSDIGEKFIKNFINTI